MRFFLVFLCKELNGLKMCFKVYGRLFIFYRYDLFDVFGDVRLI